MFENRTKTNGSAYLAETLFSRHPLKRKSAYKVLSRLCVTTVFVKGFRRPESTIAPSFVILQEA